MPTSCLLPATVALGVSLTSLSVPAEENPDLLTTRGNAELPNVLYITPWRAPRTKHKTQSLTLHSLYGDLFEPLEPGEFKAFVDAYYAVTQPTPNDLARHR